MRSLVFRRPRLSEGRYVTIKSRTGTCLEVSRSRRCPIMLASFRPSPSNFRLERGRSNLLDLRVQESFSAIDSLVTSVSSDRTVSAPHIMYDTSRIVSCASSVTGALCSTRSARLIIAIESQLSPVVRLSRQQTRRSSRCDTPRLAPNTSYVTEHVRVCVAHNSHRFDQPN